MIYQKLRSLLSVEDKRDELWLPMSTGAGDPRAETKIGNPASSCVRHGHVLYKDLSLNEVERTWAIYCRKCPLYVEQPPAGTETTWQPA